MYNSDVVSIVNTLEKVWQTLGNDYNEHTDRYSRFLKVTEKT